MYTDKLTYKSNYCILILLGPVTFSINANLNPGRAEIEIDEQSFVVGGSGLTTREASVFCQSVTGKKYVFGNVYKHATTINNQTKVLMTNVWCLGKEKDFLECSADFLPEYTVTTTQTLAYFECHMGGKSCQKLFLYFLTKVSNL